MSAVMIVNIRHNFNINIERSNEIRIYRPTPRV